jgi:hypothetical protein
MGTNVRFILCTSIHPGPEWQFSLMFSNADIVMDDCPRFYQLQPADIDI